MAQFETHRGDDEMSAQDRMTMNARVARIAADDTIVPSAYRARIIAGSKPSPRLAAMLERNAL